MIRYNYLTQLQPPAPFINVNLRNPVTGVEKRDVPAQLDCAADRTVVPEGLATALALPQIGSIPIGGIGGFIQSMPAHPVEISIHNEPGLVLEVVASPGESWILLGRDFLNVHRVLLDGPALKVEIG